MLAVEVAVTLETELVVVLMVEFAVVDTEDVAVEGDDVVLVVVLPWPAPSSP